jgi:uncharacterized protein (TIGR03382 family)
MANKLCALCVAAAGALSLGAAASAALTDPFILVTATNASGTGTLSIPLMDTTPGPNGSVSFSLAAPVDIMDGANVIGTVTQLNSTVRPLFGAMPHTITLSFTFFAGASDTTFEVDTTLFTFDDDLLDERARATAGMTVTDSNGDGATATGNGAGGAAYNARYNGQPGTTFADLLVGPLVAGSGQSNTADDRSPPGAGFTPIGANVTDMSARWDFDLTAGDQVGVTSSYFMVPAPGALALLGLAGLAVSRRRR